MSNYVNDLNDLITAKSEIKNIIQDTLNENPSEVFSYWPSYIARIAASSEGPYVVSYSYLSENYPDFTYLYAYVADAVESGGGSVDLSSYVTYSYAYETYPTYSYADNKYFGRLVATISDGNVISSIGESFDAGASVRGIYFQMTYVPSYAYIESYYTTKSELSSAGYLTSSDLPVIDENIIPKETNTYTLGDNSYYYNAAYTSNIYLSEKNAWVNTSNWQTKFKIDGSDKYMLTSNRFYPYNTGAAHLGSSGNKWGDTYTENLYAPNINLSSDGKHSIKISGSDIRLAYNDIGFYLNSNGFRPGVNGTKTLGTSSAVWGTTYTANLRADTAYLNNSTYLPVNTYWYDGSTYHWLGDLFN